MQKRVARMMQYLPSYDVIVLWASSFSYSKLRMDNNIGSPSPISTLFDFMISIHSRKLVNSIRICAANQRLIPILN